MGLEWDIEIRPPKDIASYYEFGKGGSHKIKEKIQELIKIEPKESNHWIQTNQVQILENRGYKFTGEANNQLFRIIKEVAREGAYDFDSWKSAIFELTISTNLEDYEILVIFG